MRKKERKNHILFAEKLNFLLRLLLNLLTSRMSSPPPPTHPAHVSTEINQRVLQYVN